MGTIGILSAIVARESSHKGQHIDISMQDAQISLLNYMATMFFLSGKQPPAIGNSHFVHVPYDSFKTQDGHIIVAIITDGLWQKFIKLTELHHLDTDENKNQPGRWKNRANIMNDVCNLLIQKPNDHWLNLLQKNGIPCAPVNTFSQALKDPHILARNMVVSVQHPSGQSVKQVGNPIKMSDHTEQLFTPPPLTGQDTNKVLESLLGISTEALADLRLQGIIQ